MYRYILFIVLISSSAFGQQWIDSKAREIVFQNVNIIPMDTERVIANQTIVVNNGLITAIGANPKYGKDALIIDGKGKYLMPGLAEMHAHVPPRDNLEEQKEVLNLFAYAGITTIRGMLGHESHLKLRSMINDEEIIGPRLYTTGPSFNGISITSPEMGEETVRNQKAAGYDYLKMHPGLSKENFAAIAKTANEVGIPFVGHVSFGVGIWASIDAGYSSIDHLDGFLEGMVPGIENMTSQDAGFFGAYVANKVDRTKIPQLMKELKEHTIWVVPTQALAERWFSPEFDVVAFRNGHTSKFMDPKILDQWEASKKGIVGDERYSASEANQYIHLRRELILECQKNGIGLLLGCDAPQVFNVPGFSTHEELAYLVESGLTPYQALRTGTVNVGTYLGLKNLGMVKEGYIADLVLLNNNPLENIHNSSAIAGVMIKGNWISKKEIEIGYTKLEKR